MVLCLGEPLGGLCHVGCCCYFPHWRILCFRAIFPCHQHLTLASQTCECLQQLWALTWLISFALLLPGFSVTVLPRALRFWGGILYPQAFFTLHTFPRFLALFVVFVTQMRGRNTQSRILLCAYPHRVVTYGWRMDLNYSCCNYKTIDLSIAPVIHKV